MAETTLPMTTKRGRGARWAPLVLSCLIVLSSVPVEAAPFPTTRRDFELPGTQPLSLTHGIATPADCTGCHAGYGSPEVEPYRNWIGSMMGQTGRDPITWAAMAIANQDAEHSGETCLRCHLPRGWLEGRSAPEDGTGMTADDRHGVQCGVCHRLVDPAGGPGAPPEDAAILAALTAPVTTIGGAQMVVDPEDRLRGPFDAVADLGSDPHLPTRSTLVSPYHKTSELCGTCHNVRIPTYTRNLITGEYELNTIDEPGDFALAFPEQATYDEWAASEYAAGGVYAPQFGKNQPVVETCQDCHMPAVTGKAANLGIVRDDLPLHEFLGANTFAPAIIPYHPTFGPEVDAALLAETVVKNTKFLRKSATVTATIESGTLAVRVQNDTGHKLPTGYPEGRRMWLHVRAYDAQRNVVFESGRYGFADRTLAGHNALPSDADYDPHLRVWEAVHGISPAAAAAYGVTPGPSSHLVLNNVREHDNRIPPRGFSLAAFEAFDGAPIPATYVDGQYWDDVSYPVGASAVRAEVVLYYQTATREYIEFLRDANTTNAAGPILFDLYDQYSPSPPVEMARLFVETSRAVLDRCRSSISKQQAKYLKTYQKEWQRCYATAASGLVCDTGKRDAKIASARNKLAQRVGGIKDKRCLGASLTPASLGHGPVCPVPCADDVVFAMNELAACTVCTSEALAAAALGAGYGTEPPFLPTTAPSGAPRKCQDSVAKAATGLSTGWSRALARCESGNSSGTNEPPVDCSSDPQGEIAAAVAKSNGQIAGCSDFSGLPGCPAGGDVASTQACVTSAIATYVPGYTEAAYP
jgi:hypothetical protein